MSYGPNWSTSCFYKIRKKFTETVACIYLHVVCGCFCNKTVGLKIVEETVWTTNIKYLVWPFTEKVCWPGTGNQTWQDSWPHLATGLPRRLQGRKQQGNVCRSVCYRARAEMGGPEAPSSPRNIPSFKNLPVQITVYQYRSCITYEHCCFVA